MIAGLTVQELANRIQADLPKKRDFVAPTNLVRMTDDAKIVLGNQETPFEVSDLALAQVGDRVGIPDKYLKRMRSEAPQLLAHNVNHWFNDKPEKRMIRTLDGNVRAFLSDRYRPIDNIDVATNLLPKLLQSGCTVQSSQITEKRLYIQAFTPRVITDISKSKVGDFVHAGIVISNSEVGCGSVKIEPMIYRVRCTNGLVMPDMSMKKFHIGGRSGGSDDSINEYLSDETRKLDDKAFWAKVNDVASAMLEQGSFEKIAARFAATQDRKLIAEPTRIVELAQEKHDLAESEAQLVLRHLCEGGDFTQFGLVNAVTRSAQDVADYDRAVELERLGGEIMELTNAAYLN